MFNQKTAQVKFTILTTILQAGMAVLFGIMVRYDKTADSAYIQNRLGNDDLKGILDQYPMIIDIHVMLFAGFGFLMTFLTNYGYSAVSFTIIITATVTEFAILVIGWSRLAPGEYIININFLHVLEGGLAAASVLISFGVVIGKCNPLQLLVMGLIETVLFTINMHLGYSVFGAIDVGGSMFIHAFGAYFGVMVGLTMKFRNYAYSEDKQGTNSTTDVFSLLGSILLWLYWPSFNALLATDDARHRAYINTYISLLAATVCTFIASAIFGGGRRFQAVDVQNATLAGGVIVGATADLMLQPYGAFAAGCVGGLVSTFGYQVLQPFLFDTLNLHDSCGVNNLHGIPGILGGLLSVMICAMANENVYGPALYVVLPNMAPENGTDKLAALQAQLPQIGAGVGRSAYEQAMVQLACLGISLAFAIVGGLITGFIIHIDWIFNILKDHELFEDAVFFDGVREEPEDDEVPVANAPTTVSSVVDPSFNDQTFGKEELLNGDTIYYDPRRASQTFHPGMQLQRHSVVAPHPHQAPGDIPPPVAGHYNYAFEAYNDPSPAPEHLSYMS